MIIRKCKCEGKVNSRKLALLKTVFSGKVALAKMFNYFEKAGVFKE